MTETPESLALKMDSPRFCEELPGCFVLRESHSETPSDPRPIVTLESRELSKDRLCVARSAPRHPETGAVCVDLHMSGALIPARVPIWVFIDLDTALFSRDDVADLVNDWIDVAKRYPSVKRNCICCRSKAVGGGILCVRCEDVYGEAVYA